MRSLLLTFVLFVGTALDLHAQGGCETQERYEERQKQIYGRLLQECAKGPCDSAGLRNQWIPTPSDTFVTIRLYFNLFHLDDGSGTAGSASAVATRMSYVNEMYAPHKIKFVYGLRHINSTAAYQHTRAEDSALKTEYAIFTGSRMNVYVVSRNGTSGYGHFPWDSDPTGNPGGIVIPDSGTFALSNSITHEIGHTLGLWHSFRGHDEAWRIDSSCYNCYEPPGATNGDVVGDLCADTPPEPVIFGCAHDSAIDTLCSGLYWGYQPQDNYMCYGYYAGLYPECRDHFTLQQAGRMHCWINEVLQGWTRPMTLVVSPSGPYTTIQSAISDAISLDTVKVSPGAYSGTGNTDLDFQGKAIVLKSSAGAATTIIDCGGSARAFSMEMSELTGSRIVGFTIKDGYAYGNGGAVSLNNVSATFDSCVFRSCEASQGGAVYADGSTGYTLNITNCVFDSNSAGGGGAAIYTKVRTRLTGNTLVKNTSDAVRPAVITIAGTPDTISLVRQNITNNSTYALDFVTSPASVTLHCCNFYQNGGGNVNPSSAVQPTIPDTNNIILTQNPLYCDFANRVYSLRWDSPCSYEHQPACSSVIGAVGVGCGTPVTLVIPTSGNYENATPNLVWQDILEADLYTVQVDDNSNFSSPDRSATDLTATSWVVSPELTNGTWYWHVRGKDTTYNVTGPWSAAWDYTKVSAGGGTSCPILFTYDGGRYHKENPLLTACENYGYQKTVTDYYHVTKPVEVASGGVRFQLREMDNEISYFNSLALMTVDHDATTKVAGGGDGSITLYRETISPLSVSDQYGVDRLSQVRAKDGEIFSANGPGYLEVTFPNTLGDLIVYPTIKRFCQDGMDSTGIGEKVSVGNAGNPQLQVEVQDSLGQWVSLGEIPPREQLNQELIGGVYPVRADASVVVFRITWSQKYSTDIIQQVIPISDEPTVNQWTVSTADMSLGDGTAKPVSFHNGLEPVVLNKGDILDFSFACGEPPNGQMRDYIVVARGRYEPTNSASAIPVTFQLEQNYPNPFNPTTTITFALPNRSNVKLTIFNMLGQEVATLVDREMTAGRHTVSWNGRNADGSEAASGIYLYRLTADDFTDVKKMLYLK